MNFEFIEAAGQQTPDPEPRLVQLLEENNLRLIRVP
jgi:hypothetical protein